MGGKKGGKTDTKKGAKKNNKKGAKTNEKKGKNGKKIDAKYAGKTEEEIKIIKEREERQRKNKVTTTKKMKIVTKAAAGKLKTKLRHLSPKNVLIDYLKGVEGKTAIDLINKELEIFEFLRSKKKVVPKILIEEYVVLKRQEKVFLSVQSLMLKWSKETNKKIGKGISDFYKPIKLDDGKKVAKKKIAKNTAKHFDELHERKVARHFQGLLEKHGELIGKVDTAFVDEPDLMKALVLLSTIILKGEIKKEPTKKNLAEHFKEFEKGKGAYSKQLEEMNDYDFQQSVYTLPGYSYIDGLEMKKSQEQAKVDEARYLAELQEKCKTSLKDDAKVQACKALLVMLDGAETFTEVAIVVGVAMI